MITVLQNLPNNMVGFRASADVTKEDFQEVVLPAVDKLVSEKDELNYLMIIDTPLTNFSFGAWWKDAIMGLKNITKWHRAAIVSDSNGIIHFTNLFSWIVPGKFRGFKPEELQEAIRWTSRITN